MFKVGDKVVFGRENGEKTLGTVVKVNAKSVTIRQDEERGASRVREVGTRWRAHTPEMKAFVSTYGLYNHGRLIGRWFDAFELDDEDAVMDELRAKALAAGIPEDDLDGVVGEEFMIQDHEGFPVPVSESQAPSSLAEIADACDDPYTYERVCLYAAAKGAYDTTLEEILAATEDMIVMPGTNLEDAVWNYLEETGSLAEIPEWAKNYFDCASYGRDMLCEGWTEVSLDGNYYLVCTN